MSVCIWMYDGWMDRVEELEVRSWRRLSLDGIWYDLGIWVKMVHGVYISGSVYSGTRWRWKGGSLVSSQYTLAPTAINVRLVLALIAVVLKPFF